jgi:hypothetical protein
LSSSTMRSERSFRLVMAILHKSKFHHADEQRRPNPQQHRCAPHRSKFHKVPTAVNPYRANCSRGTLSHPERRIAVEAHSVQCSKDQQPLRASSSPRIAQRAGAGAGLITDDEVALELAGSTVRAQEILHAGGDQRQVVRDHTAARCRTMERPTVCKRQVMKPIRERSPCVVVKPIDQLQNCRTAESHAFIADCQL